jgi:predicted nucleic acid-binding protein
VSRLFVATSVLVALAFEESDHDRIVRNLESADDLFASPLLEAEYRSALAREGLTRGEADNAGELLAWFRWVLPNRPLSRELDRVFSAGSARGADAWHLATALFVAEDPADLPFYTLDQRQRDVAMALGFPTPS